MDAKSCDTDMVIDQNEDNQMHPEVSSEDSHSEVESVIGRYRLTIYEKKTLKDVQICRLSGHEICV